MGIPSRRRASLPRGSHCAMRLELADGSALKLSVMVYSAAGQLVKIKQNGANKELGETSQHDVRAHLRRQGPVPRAGPQATVGVNKGRHCHSLDHGLL